MKSLIFGSNGQDGYYLKNFLNKIGHETFTCSRSKADYIGSVYDKSFVKTVIKKINPDYIFNFAAISKTSHQFIYENFDTISIGTINILESVKSLKYNSKIFLTGSAYQFVSGTKINEKTDFNPSNQYNINRINSVYLSRYYRKEFGLKVYVGYLFHHDSPFRTDEFINIKILNFAKKIKRNNSVSKLELFDLEFTKEYNYAKDIVKGVWSLVNQDKYFEAVIGSGKGYSIRDWCKTVFGKLDLDWTKHIINLKKVNDDKAYVSSPILINKIGWKSNTNIDQLADILLNNNING